MVKYMKNYTGRFMEIFKKLSLILILVVGTILFISCNKKTNDISKEKENKQLEAKDLSIFELIKTSIQNNGELPEDFRLPLKDPNGVPWADGAMDGVYIYHTVRNEEDIEPLKNIVFQISEGRFEEAQTNLDKLNFSMVSRRNSLLNWIIQEQKQINLNNLYQFTSSQLTSSKNIEVIKFCLCILAIMNVETDKDTIEKVKTLALSDEFTLYCLDIILKLENSNEEIFKIVKYKILTENSTALDWKAFVALVQQGQPFTIKVERNQEIFDKTLQPEKNRDGKWFVGLSPTFLKVGEQYRTELKYGILDALQKGVEKTGQISWFIVKAIGKLFSGELSFSSLAGPISIAQGAGASSNAGVIYFLSFLALISVNLGIMNLFPLPVLDGGHLVFLAAEAIKGKPVSERVQNLSYRIGLTILLIETIFVLFNDFLRL